MAEPLTALEYIDREWLAVVDRVHVNYEDERRSEWERVVETSTKIYGHEATRAAIVEHINHQGKP